MSIVLIFQWKFKWWNTKSQFQRWDTQTPPLLSSSFISLCLDIFEHVLSSDAKSKSIHGFTLLMINDHAFQIFLCHSAWNLFTECCHRNRVERIYIGQHQAFSMTLYSSELTQWNAHGYNSDNHRQNLTWLAVCILCCCCCTSVLLLFAVGNAISIYI